MEAGDGSGHQILFFKIFNVFLNVPLYSLEIILQHTTETQLSLHLQYT